MILNVNIYYFNRVCLTLSYSVVMMSSGEKTDGNPFLEIVWQSMAEIPGYFLAAYFADRIGRRYTGGMSFSIMAATWILLVFRESSKYKICNMVTLIILCFTLVDRISIRIKQNAWLWLSSLLKITLATLPYTIVLAQNCFAVAML